VRRVFFCALAVVLGRPVRCLALSSIAFAARVIQPRQATGAHAIDNPPPDVPLELARDRCFPG